VVLRTVWIPRAINFVADIISKIVDYEDYSVTDEFFHLAQQLSGYIPNMDRFANNWNAKCLTFNSLSYCVGSSGVDAFAYNWGPPTKNWLFPPPRLVGRTLLHLQKCKGEGLLLVPFWKSAAFYPLLTDLPKSIVKGKWSLHGGGIFKRGADAASCFGPDFTGMVELWLLQF